MRVEIPEHDRMTESGSSLLRLIQNNGTCNLDLFVREAIQNSLDAGDKKHDYVRVDIKTGQFYTQKVSSYFEKISDNLNSRYPGKQDYISIRDTNTVGLTGPVRYSEVKDSKLGNLLKLVYEISKPQDQSGAGGSWGLGKTVFFRIGIGLVIYYSRIKKSNSTRGYESRLAATLVEDETKSEMLLPKSNIIQRGIAWWGNYTGKNHKHTVPLTNEREIHSILDQFGIKRFSGSETGTEIIIPFIDTKRLLNETILGSFDNDSVGAIPNWCNNIDDYLRIAIQRWYAPRLNNKSYNGQYMEVYINNAKITQQTMAPFFRLIQSLYNSHPDNELKFSGKKVNCKYVELRSIFEKGDNNAGYISYIIISAQDMKMMEPDNLRSPYYYINKLVTDSFYNDPIIMYTRKPGMIVSYETTGDWTDSIPKTPTNEFIVGLFVANSDNILNINHMSFEEYIRGSEKADHMGWEDWPVNGNNLQIITKIKRNIRRKIKDEYPVENNVTEEHKNLGLGKALADYLLPPTGIVYWDDARGGLTGPGGVGGMDIIGDTSLPGKRINNTSHVVLKQTGNPIFNIDGINLPVQILFGSKSVAILQMCVDSEKGSISGVEWEKSTGASFPISLKYFSLTRITKGKSPHTRTIYNGIVKIDKKWTKYGIQIKLMNTPGVSVFDRINISFDNADNYVVDGIVTCGLYDVQGTITLKEEDE